MTCTTLAKDIDQSIAATSNVASDHVVFTRNATAYKIPFSAFSESLGVTGTLNTIGAPTATSILSKPSQGYNYIRGLAASQGITATLDPHGSIAIKTNLANSGGSAQIIKDTTAAQVGLRGVTAGDGITIDQRTNDILISTNTATATTKTVIVTEIADFPVPSGGVITLANNTDYFLANDLSTADRFIVGTNTAIRGPASQIVSLTYTGTGTMLTSTNPNFRADRVTLGCPNGTLFDISSSGGGIFQMIETTISSCQNIGTIGDMFLIRFKGLAYQNVIAGGVVLTGVNDILVFDTSVMFLNGGTAYDFGTSIFNNLTITNQFVESDTAGTKFISGATGSANIAVGGLADVTNCRTDPATTPLTGVSTDDVRWEFLGNNTIPNTRPDSLLSTTGNALQTTIAAIGVAVKANAVFVDDDTSQFVTTSDGRTTYIGEKDASLPISLTATLLAAAGGDKQLSAYIAINGVIVPQTISTVTASSAKSNVAPSIWQPVFTNGDYVEIWVANDTTTDNVIVVNAVIRIN